MKLSEAIRLGAMLGPQIKGALFGVNQETCAIGAAMLAHGIKCRSTFGLEQHFPILDVAVDCCPACGMGDALLNSVWTVVVHLNNHCNWTREQIAGWVETIEREQEAKIVPLEQPELVGAEL